MAGNDRDTRRLQLSLRTLFAMVTIVAIIVGSIVRVQRSLAVMRAQISVTEDLFRQESETLGGSSRFQVAKMSFSTGRVGANRWNHRVQVDLKDERRQNVVREELLTETIQTHGESLWRLCVAGRRPVSTRVRRSHRG